MDSISCSELVVLARSCWLLSRSGNLSPGGQEEISKKGQDDLAGAVVGVGA